MKKIVSVILALVLLLSLAACSGGAENDSSSVNRAGTDAVKTVGEKIGDKTAETLETKSDSGTTVQISKPVTIKKELDGVTLTVMLEKTKIKVGEDLKLTAKVTNNSGKDIVSMLPIYNELHYEIRTTVETDDGKYFFDKDYPIEIAENLERPFTVKNAESYTQEMTLVPAEIKNYDVQNIEYYPAGKCTGEAVFHWDRSEDYKHEKVLKIEFEVEIV